MTVTTTLQRLHMLMLQHELDDLDSYVERRRISDPRITRSDVVREAIAEKVASDVEVKKKARK